MFITLMLKYLSKLRQQTISNMKLKCGQNKTSFNQDYYDENSKKY